MRPKDDLSLTDRGSILRTSVLSTHSPELSGFHPPVSRSRRILGEAFVRVLHCQSCLLGKLGVIKARSAWKIEIQSESSTE